jgi:hypothetical protein
MSAHHIELMRVPSMTVGCCVGRKAAAGVVGTHKTLVSEVQNMNTRVKQTYNTTLLTPQQLDKLQLDRIHYEKLSPSIRFNEEPIDLQKMKDQVETQHNSLKDVLNTTLEQILSFMVDKGWHDVDGEVIVAHIP